MTDPYAELVAEMSKIPVSDQPRRTAMSPVLGMPYAMEERPMTRIQQVATKLAAVSVEQWLAHPDKQALMKRIAEELSQLPEFNPSPFVRHWT